ncbi:MULTISPECIES: hypothetical protein [Aquimarina]|uniref:hypothetical protein n=1 Tax=Aquimarina TaxID=290174 RepID=UPI00143086AC|nr:MULTISPECIES: hypothetical protein [Aquimarina]
MNSATIFDITKLYITDFKTLIVISFDNCINIKGNRMNANRLPIFLKPTYAFSEYNIDIERKRKYKINNPPSCQINEKPLLSIIEKKRVNIAKTIIEMELTLKTKANGIVADTTENNIYIILSNFINLYLARFWLLTL